MNTIDKQVIHETVGQYVLCALILIVIVLVIMYFTDMEEK